MKRYLKEDLVKFAKQVISIQYDNPQKILEAFRTDIKKFVKSKHAKVLTDKEIENYSLEFVNDFFSDLDKISLEIISVYISTELVNKSNIEGIELKDYKDYFIMFAKEMVKKLLLLRFKHLKIQIRKARNK